MDSVRDEYLSSTGYVLQSATPYYEELTVRLVSKKTKLSQIVIHAVGFGELYVLPHIAAALCTGWCIL